MLNGRAQIQLLVGLLLSACKHAMPRPGPAPAPLHVTLTQGALDVQPIELAGKGVDLRLVAPGLGNPPMLVPNGDAVALDLPRRKLLHLQSQGAANAYKALTAIGVPVTWCGDQPGTLPIVEATIDGHAVHVSINTGSSHTIIFADSEAGLNASRTAQHFLKADAFADEGFALTRVAVKVANTSVSLPAMIAKRIKAGSACELDGLLGLDVLQRCTILLNGANSAMACDATGPEPATALAFPSTTVVPATPQLAEQAAPLQPGVVARLGCDQVRLADLPGAQPAKADEVVREKLIARLANLVHANVSPSDIDRELKNIQLREGLDDAAFAKALAAQGSTLAAFRSSLNQDIAQNRILGLLLLSPALVTDADVDSELARRGIQADQHSQPWEDVRTELASRSRDAVFETLLAGVRDRLARVAVTSDNGTCLEQWPYYFLEQITFVGINHQDEHDLRLAVAQSLQGQAVEVDATGVPFTIVSAAQSLFGSRVVLTMHEQPQTLRINVRIDRTSVGSQKQGT